MDVVDLLIPLLIAIFSIVLLFKCLRTENKILKQKLPAAQDVNYEKEKKKVVNVGCRYECNSIKQYNSKHTNEINISLEVASLQNIIGHKMNEHRNRLDEWEKNTQHLQTTFAKANIQNINEEDIKELDDSESFNVSRLYLSYKDCMELLQEQQQRTEDVLIHCVDLNSQTTALQSTIQKYNINIPDMKNEYDELNTNYNLFKKQREDLQQTVERLVGEINNLIGKENETNNKKCETLDKYNLFGMELGEYSKLLTISRTLRNKYSSFDNNAENVSNELNNYFILEWDKHESNWNKWDVNDIICWLKYLIHDNKLRLSKSFNLKIIEEKMRQQQIVGLSLSKMDKSDLKLFGFAIFDDREQTYKKIRALVEKYHKNNDNDSNMDKNVKTVNEEKEGYGIKIPKEYLCPISNKIMINPVVAYDNNTYDKENIIQYIKKYKKTPNSKQESDGSEPLFKNKQLKMKIEQFLWANPQIEMRSTSQ